MFNRTHSFTRAVITGGLLSLAVATADTYAAPVAAIQEQPAQAAPAQATPDSELAAKIRKAIGDDTALAAYVPTLKIVVSDGLVTLKGAVKSEADKKAIGQKVDEIAGAKNVMNNLFVSTETKPAPETP
jgi:osmotically-inducible protein OsmY